MRKGVKPKEIYSKLNITELENYLKEYFKDDTIRTATFELMIGGAKTKKNRKKIIRK